MPLIKILSFLLKDSTDNTKSGFRGVLKLSLDKHNCLIDHRIDPNLSKPHHSLTAEAANLLLRQTCNQRFRLLEYIHILPGWFEPALIVVTPRGRRWSLQFSGRILISNS